jgi:hypothetical protein
MWRKRFFTTELLRCGDNLFYWVVLGLFSRESVSPW